MAKVKGNPVPVGLFGFGLSCFVLSCYTAGLPDMHRPITDPVNMIVGLAVFYGGIVQIIVGVLEMHRGNTMSATVFTSYGAYWLSYASILIPSFGIASAYQNVSPQTFSNAIGIFLLGWAIFTLILLVASLRDPIAIVLLFITAFCTYLLLAVAAFTGSVTIHRLAGFAGIVTAIVACYNAVEGLLESMEASFMPWCKGNKCSTEGPIAAQDPEVGDIL